MNYASYYWKWPASWTCAPQRHTGAAIWPNPFYGHILIQFLKCNYFAPQSRCRVLPRPSRCHPWYIKRKINNESEKNKRRHPPGTVSIFRYLTSQLLLFLPSFLNITFYSCLRWKIFSFLTHQITLSLRLFIGPGKLHVGVIDCYRSL